MRIDNDRISFPFEAQGIAAGTLPELNGVPAPAGTTWLVFAVQIRGLLTDRSTPVPAPQIFDLQWASKTDCGVPDPYVCASQKLTYLEAIQGAYDPKTWTPLPPSDTGDVTIAPGQAANVLIRAQVPEDDFDLSTARLVPGVATGESTLANAILTGDHGQTIPLGSLPESPISYD